MMKLKNKGILIIIFLCITSSCVVGGTEEKVFEVETDPFMFHGKELSLGPGSHEPDSFQKEYGKASFIEAGMNDYWSIGYDDDGIILGFDSGNGHDGSDLNCILFDMNVLDKVILFGLTINKSDTYTSIRKKLEDKNLNFTVLEDPRSRWSFYVQIIDLAGGGMDRNITIHCYPTSDRGVSNVLYER